MSEPKLGLRLETTREWREHRLMREALRVICRRTEPEPWEHPSDAHRIADHVLSEIDG